MKKRIQRHSTKHREPSKSSLSKGCIRCFKNDIIDGTEFIAYATLCKYFNGNICIECHPHLYKQYKLENPTLTEELKHNKERLSQQQTIK